MVSLTFHLSKWKAQNQGEYTSLHLWVSIVHSLKCISFYLSIEGQHASPSFCMPTWRKLLGLSCVCVEELEAGKAQPAQPCVIGKTLSRECSTCSYICQHGKVYAVSTHLLALSCVYLENPLAARTHLIALPCDYMERPRRHRIKQVDHVINEISLISEQMQSLFMCSQKTFPYFLHNLMTSTLNLSHTDHTLTPSPTLPIREHDDASMLSVAF